MKLDCNTIIDLLSHTDTDGYGSEIVLRSMGLNPRVKNLENSQVDSHIEKYVNELLEGKKSAPDVLFITDISPNSEVGKKVEELYQAGLCDIYLFDHHPTALELNQYKWATVIPEVDGFKPCGTSLLFNFIKDKVDVDSETFFYLNRLVEEIRLYDTWAWEAENHVSAKTLNDLFYLVGHDRFVESQIQKIQTHEPALFSPDELKLLEVENRRIEKYLKHKNEDMVIIPNFFTDGEGNPMVAGVVQADNYFSELGHFLCDEHPEIDFALLLNLTHNKASLRAVKEDVTLVPIVKRYGGGGHAHAAGCSITPMGANFMQILFEKIAQK